MQYKQITDPSFNTITSGPAVKRSVVQEHLPRDRELGRKMILSGWIISMVGIVTYCFVMLNGDQQFDLLSGLSPRAAVGWAALLVILVGVVLWFAGCVRFLNDADCSSTQAGDQ